MKHVVQKIVALSLLCAGTLDLHGMQPLGGHHEGPTGSHVSLPDDQQDQQPESAMQNSLTPGQLIVIGLIGASFAGFGYWFPRAGSWVKSCVQSAQKKVRQFLTPEGAQDHSQKKTLEKVFGGDGDSKKPPLQEKKLKIPEKSEKTSEIKQPEKPVGFQNQGNSCYLTAGVLVPLLHSPKAVKALLEKGEKCKDPIIKQFYLLAKKMYGVEKRPESLAYPDLNEAFCQGLEFEKCDQQDAFEALDKFLDYANKFLGIPLTFTRVAVCAQCGAEKMTYNEQHVQFLPQKNLEDGLRDYFGKRNIVFKWEQQNLPLDETIKVTLSENADSIKDRCPKCTLNPKLPVETQSYSTLTSLPVLLCVGVERNKTPIKCMDPIEIPLVLSVADFCSDELLKSLKNPDATTYVLRALTVHRGTSFKYGHYISYVCIDDKWWQVNDSTVSDRVSVTYDHRQSKSIFASADEIVRLMTSGKSLTGDLEHDTPVIAIYEQADGSVKPRTVPVEKNKREKVLLPKSDLFPKKDVLHDVLQDNLQDAGSLDFKHLENMSLVSIAGRQKFLFTHAIVKNPVVKMLVQKPVLWLKKPIGFANEEKSCYLENSPNKWKQNSCYIIASVLAALLHSPVVIDVLLERGEKSSSTLIRELYLLAKQMYRSELALEKIAWPGLYKTLVSELKLEWGEIGDAEAVLSSLLRYMAKQWPDVALSYQQKLTCGRCTVESDEIKPDVFLVPCEKGKGPALKMTKKGTLFCQTCGGDTDFTRTFTKLPKLFCVGVNRVGYENRQGIKIMDPLQIEHELSFAELCSPEIKQKAKYGLRAVIVHRGSEFDSGGHYFSYVCLEGDKWWQIDDSVVSDKVCYGLDFKTENGLFMTADEIVKIMTSGQQVPGDVLDRDTPVIAVYEQKQV